MTRSPLRVLLLYAEGERNRTLSYQTGWPIAFRGDPRFACTEVNVLRPRAEVLARLVAARVKRLDGVVVLHSVFSNEPLLAGPALDLVAGVGGPKAYFIGNEYKLMPEKLAFAERLGTSLLITQSTTGGARELYRDRLGCEVVGIPNTGFDPELFAPRAPLAERPIDLGFRSYESPPYLGHAERREIVDRVVPAAQALGLRLDVSMDASARFGMREWAAFLNRCRGQLGTEAGGDYFELDDRTRYAVSGYLEQHPDAGIEEIKATFFDGYESPVSGRVLSGRVVEAAGTKTVQLLLEGAYGGYFTAGEHYVALRKDYTNVDEALQALADDALCARLTDAAYEVTLAELTWDRLLGRFHAAYAPLAA